MKTIILFFMSLMISNFAYCAPIPRQYIEYDTVSDNRSDWPVMPQEYNNEERDTNPTEKNIHQLYGPPEPKHDDGYCMTIHTSKKIDGENKNITFNSCDKDY
ncbi:MAG: hypothetical protein [Caudoviricetes sp.]|nr:MAG: hypothetical protein [Caudoviricetes sp.]